MGEINLTPIVDYQWNETSPFITIALKKIENYPNQRHIGILHKRIDRNPSMLHLVWHHKLINNDLDSIVKENYYVIIPINLDPESGRALAGLCRRIIKRNPQIPYGIIFEGSNFSKDGILRLGKRSHGLTCATFVMAVFASFGKDLLREDEWILRKQDIAWHSSIIKTLEETKSYHDISDEHIMNIRKEIGCVRFRPEEVAASMLNKTIPVSFKFASEVGAKIVEMIPD